MEKATLAEKVKGCTLFVINGANYFGKVVNSDNVIKVTNAVPVVGGSTFESTVKTWIQKDNAGTLEAFDTEGLASFTKKNLNEEQLMLIDSIAARAAYIKKTTLASLQNERIADI